MKTKFLALIGLVALSFSACEKQDQLTTTDEAALLKSATITVNDVAVETVSQEASYEADFYAQYEHLLRQLAHLKGKKGDLFAGRKDLHYQNGKGPIVSIDTAATGYPIIITIDYRAGTTLHHGRVISGVVKIEISADKNTDGSTRKLTYSNCVIDSIGINGSSLVTFNGDNTSTRKITHANDAIFKLANGTVIERNGNEMHQWLKGLETVADRSDDMIQITGSTSVKSSTGDNYTRAITDPLIRLGSCRHHVQGILKYTQNGEVIAEINFGDGTCDNLAQLTSNGTTVDIELKDRMPKADLKKRKDKNSGKG
jgi:hypothetical protein